MVRRKSRQFFVLIFLITACSAGQPSPSHQPPANPLTAIDFPLSGTFAKLDPDPPQWWKCYRCADYRPAGGIWKMEFTGDQMQIRYEVSGWNSSASVEISDNQISLSNDPYCREAVGKYEWSLDEAGLHFQVIEDACAFGLRAKNLTEFGWKSCEADPQAPGCSVTEGLQPFIAEDLELSVTVHQGDARKFDDPPELIVPANSLPDLMPEGIEIVHHPGSIPYGYNRVLWWQGESIEISHRLTTSSLGVQFLGDPYIGWASIYFDDAQVWRGDTSQIWSELGRHGGYIEVSHFSSGPHSMRIEVVGDDYRPVTVAFFGVND